ncbi:MAG: hypothetical protein ACRDLF_10910 [Solirubrobacteraceae bacterium]
MEGRPAIDTVKICACLERLADQRSGQRKSRSAKGDHRIYRIKVRSAQGTSETLNILIDTGHKRQPEPVLERIADQLRVSRDQLDEVAARWSKEDFLAHCAKLDAADLKPPSMRVGAPGAAPPRARR